MVDFALETTAGLALMATALALASAALPPRRRLSRAAAFVVVATSAVVVLAAAPGAIGDWRFRLDRMIVNAPLKSKTSTLHTAMAARPFDAVLAAQLAVDARERHQPKEALAWANRAINLWPTLTPAHLEAARALAAMGRLDQAMLSYREAIGGRHRASGQALQEAFARSPDVALRERALPDTAASRATLCKRLEEERRIDEALACADVLAARADATELHRLESLRLATLRDDDVDLRRRIDDVLGRGTPDGPNAATVARALARLEGRDAALATTAAWTGLHDPRALLEWRLAVLVTAERIDDARAALALLRPLARTAAEQDRHDRLEADLCAKAGDHGQRVLVLQRLVGRAPGDAELLATLGLAELAAGRTTSAHQTLRRVRETGRAPPSLPALERALGLPPTAPAPR
jgi:tetratricopeptide (TPR) repeat protein